MRPPVKFERPPVSEVACGITFDALGLKSYQIGLLWQRFQHAFPRVEEAPPIPLVIEQNTSFPTAPQVVQANFSTLPDLRRSWFLDEKGSTLVQVQDDRFLFNWKYVDGIDYNYPSYEVVIGKFDEHLAEFQKFVQAINLGKFSFRQLELTYVNIVGAKNGFAEVGEYGILADHLLSGSSNRFLPNPEVFAWNTTYLLPKDSGRLHVIAQAAKLLTTGEKVLKLELTARGAASDLQDSGSRREWFNMAHEWITHGFADSTTPALHKLWRRIS